MRSLDATPDARNFAAPVQFISDGKMFDLPRRKYKLALRFVDGVIAQLVERLNGIQEVRSSSLLGSTSLRLTKLCEGCRAEVKRRRAKRNPTISYGSASQLLQ